MESKIEGKIAAPAYSKRYAAAKLDGRVVVHNWKYVFDFKTHIVHKLVNEAVSSDDVTESAR